MNIAFFNELWLKHQPDQEGMLDFWNKRAASFNQHNDNLESIKYKENLINKLCAQSRLDPESLVLDIGCGSGHYALLLSKRVAEVTGLDLSPQMIKFANQNAVAGHCHNSSFEVLDWNLVDLKAKRWEKKFKLVLASKTPAVNNKAALEKMMSASSGYCCMISQADTENSIRDQLKALVSWNDYKARISRTFYCAFNILWLMGYYPEVSYLEKSRHGEIDLEDALVIYIRYFESIGVIHQDKQKKNVADYLASIAVNGKLLEKVKSKVAIMIWPV